VKKTAAQGCPREDDITIEEVFQKDDLELAILSAFRKCSICDLAWGPTAYWYVSKRS